VIVERLSRELRLGNIVDGTTSNRLKGFIRRYARRIGKISVNTRKEILPLAEAQWNDRYVSRLIKDSTQICGVLKTVVNQTGECYRRISTDDLDQFEDTSFIKNMTRIQKGVAQRYFGESVGFSNLVPDQLQYFTFLKFDSLYEPQDTRLLNYISFAYHINVVVFDAERNTVNDVTNDQVISGYVLFLYIDKDKDLSVLKYRDTILVKCSDWNEWLNGLGKWEPTFSEIWSYFCETGQHVPPIKRYEDKRSGMQGIMVYNIPFITQNYKTYLAHISDSSRPEQKEQLKLKRHGVYSMQYRDAFAFVKRKSSKRYMLHYKNSYASTTVEDLARHGIFCQNVSPIFKKVAEFDNTTMLKWWVVSNRFDNSVRGYFTEFGSMYFEEVYDTSIDPISETCVGYQWEKIKVLNSSNLQTHVLTPREVVLVLASIYIEMCTSDSNGESLLNCEIPVHKDCLQSIKPLEEFFSFNDVTTVEDNQGLKVQDHIMYNFIEDYFCRYGPFALFVDGDIDRERTRYIIDMQVYYNQIGWIDETVRECLANVTNTIRESYCKVSIPTSSWKQYIRGIPRTEKYEQLTGIPNVPCLVLMSDGNECVVQAYDIKRDRWRGMSEDRQLCYSLKRHQFSIIEDERVLPAECVVYPQLIETVVRNYTQYIPRFDSDAEYTAKVVKKIDGTYYLVELDELNTCVRLQKGYHFKWKEPVRI
jgi:hypothetical protein